MARSTEERERVIQRADRLLRRVENRDRRPTRIRLGAAVARDLVGSDAPPGTTARLWAVPVRLDPLLGRHDMAIDSERVRG